MLLRFQHRSDVPEKQPDMRFSKRRKLYANPPRDSSCQYTALLDTFNSLRRDLPGTADVEGWTLSSPGTTNNQAHLCYY